MAASNPGGAPMLPAPRRTHRLARLEPAPYAAVKQSADEEAGQQ